MINAFIFLSLTALISPILAKHFGLVGLGLSSSLCGAVEFTLNLLFLNRLMKKKSKPLMGSQELKWLAVVTLFALMFAACGVWLHLHIFKPLALQWPQWAWVSFALGGAGAGGLVSLGATLQWGPKGLANFIKSFAKKRKRFQ